MNKKIFIFCIHCCAIEMFRQWISTMKMWLFWNPKTYLKSALAHGTFKWDTTTLCGHIVGVLDTWDQNCTTGETMKHISKFWYMYRGFALLKNNHLFPDLTTKLQFTIIGKQLDHLDEMKTWYYTVNQGLLN